MRLPHVMTIAIAGFGLTSAQVASAAPTPEAWAKWVSKANGISAMIESYSDEHSYQSQVHGACDGTSGMFLTGGYPKWAAMMQPICATLFSAMKGKFKHSCSEMPRFTRELAKGMPVPEAPDVQPARQRLLAASAHICEAYGRG